MKKIVRDMFLINRIKAINLKGIVVSNKRRVFDKIIKKKDGT